MSLALTKAFASLPDPRMDRTKKHPLLSMLVMAICAAICGAEDWVSVVRFARAKLPWFETFLDLPNGIPSHDTFSRVFAMLDPDAFGQCFVKWVESIARVTEGDVVALDGKSIRRSFDRASEKGPIHMVSAWAARNSLVLGQVAVSEKSNEITAIPELLQLLAIKGAIVTIDAMGCQKAIATSIRERGADYILALKENHENLYQETVAYFDAAMEAGFSGEMTYCEEQSDGHGRSELRRVACTSDLEWLGARAAEWKGMKSVIMVDRERRMNGQVERKQHYFISSLSGDAEEAAAAIRSHWLVENRLHWTLDVAFQEDICRVRKGNGAENLSTIRRIALNLLKQEKTEKLGIKNKRLAAGWDEPYLLKVLGF